VVAVTATAGVGSVKDGIVKPINGGIHGRERGGFPGYLLPDPLASKVGPWSIECTKEIAPFERVGWYLHFTKKAISFFVFVEKSVFVSRSNSGEDGTTRGKAAAVAFVPGFSPLRRINKIWGQQRLEQRSVHGASTQVPTLMLLQNKELSQAAISWLLGQPLLVYL
jgi:hypothetical protein